MLKKLLCVVALYLVQHATAQTDSTLVPEAKGPAVVEATIDKIEASCVFQQTGRNFGRRSGYVESSDGLDPNTYRPGYHGGIWQVDQTFYDTTKAQSSYLAPEINNITNMFNINWQTTTWDDLRMPLYSGLAFRLYVTYTSRRLEIPWEIPDQATYWKAYYRTANDASEYTSKANTLETNCNSTALPDLVFVLDASGSIGASNFQLVRQFAINVVEQFAVGPTNTQVGVIVYATSSNVAFYLNRYTTQAQVIAAINNIVYTGGGTYTHLALDQLVYDVMTTARGARPDRPHVAIVMTDGASNNAALTVAAAERAHNASITMLAVGVGSSLRLEELNAIASPPKCTNLFLPKDFNDMLGVVNSIKKKVCEAPMIITPSNNGSNVGIILPPGEKQNCRLNIPVEGATVKVFAWVGSGTFYVARDTYPGPAYYEHKAYAEVGRPGTMFITHSTGSGSADIMYCSIKGNDTQESNITVEVTPGDRDWCKSSPCQNDGECQDLGNQGYSCECLAGYTGTHCEIPISSCLSAPCHAWATCQDTPNGFVCNCDVGWNGTLCDNFLGYDCGYRNPCTPEAIANEEFYWPHIDPKKFVQCNDFGECFEMDCQPGTYWDWIAETCMPEIRKQPKKPATVKKPERAHQEEVKIPELIKAKAVKQLATPIKASPAHREESRYLASYRQMIREELAKMEIRLQKKIDRALKPKK